MPQQKKSVYAANLSKNETSERSLLFWFINIILILFMIWSPFQKGLFNGNTFDFERPLYSSFIWSSIILFLVSINMYYHWTLKKSKDWISLLVWLIPLSFVISNISAASHYMSTNMIMIQLLYTTFFLIGLHLAKTSVGNNSLQNTIMFSSYFIVIFGLLNWLGNKQGAFQLVHWFVGGMNNNIYNDAVMTDSNGLRLTSVFQYANTYAAFLIAILLAGFFVIVKSNKWYLTAIHSFMTVPIILSFFLTLSRGGIVLLPLVALVVLPFLKPHRQIIYIWYAFISLALSLLILNKVTSLGTQLNEQYSASLAWSGWFSIILVSLINVIIVLLSQRFGAPWLQNKLSKIDKIRFAHIFLPAAALIIGAACLLLLFSDTGITKLLPENIKIRIENINFQQHSVLERGTFYKDAIKLFGDYPLIGAGGGAWASLYEKYQNNPYVSRQAHNFFLQYMVEVGILGSIILLLFLAAVFYVFIKNYLHSDEKERDQYLLYYIFAISLLLHSLIDFDLSFVYIGLLVFISLGAMISNDETKLNLKFNTLNRVKWVYPSVVLIISLVAFINSIQLLNANSNFRTAQAAVQSQKASLNDILTPLNNALKQHPNHPDYASFKADILLQAYDQSKDERFYNDAVSLIKQTRDQEPYNQYLINKELSTLTIKNQLTKAYDLLNYELNNFPWDITVYEKNITLAFSLGEQARTTKNTDQMNQYWDHSFAIYNKILEKNKVLEALPKEQQQGRAFGLTKPMAFSLGQIDFIRGKYAEAESFLNFQINDQFDDQMNKQMVRWYLAALQKQNKNDQVLYDKLISKDPNERDEINKLVSATF